MTEENTKEEGTECRKKVEWAEYIFDPKDTDGWLPHLEKEGYCVLKSVLSLKSVSEIIDMIWEDMEKLFGAQRGDFTTWGNIPNGTAGIVSKGLPQTRGPWQARGNENIREVFRQIWETDDLLVSMDSVLCWLPWWLNSNWKPFTEGLHLDQNPFAKPERVCVQGMVPLLDVTEISGGLEVIPRSHEYSARERFKSNHPHFNTTAASDWCPLSKIDSHTPPPILLACEAGDMILWDSRVIHGGRVGSGVSNSKGIGDDKSICATSTELARLALTVCMTPKKLATEAVLKARQKGYKKGITFSHWPHEAHMTGLHPVGYTPVELTSRVIEMIW